MYTEASPVHANRVAIIGCGNVGATTAYALLQNELVREIILIDQDADKAEGEAMDLQHAVPLGPPVQVRAGDYRDAVRSAIVVITAGAANQPGESRLDLLDRNAGIVRACVGQLMRENFNGILLMTTNPVDVLAHVAMQESGLPAPQVIGTGTVIDTARLRQMLGGKRIRPGEIGQRHAGPEVVERKGNTSYAIASCVTRICEAILRDEHTVLAVSTLLEGQYGIDDVYLGVPCVVGARGVERVIELPLSDAEQKDLRASADVLRQAREHVRGKS